MGSKAFGAAYRPDTLPKVFGDAVAMTFPSSALSHSRENFGCGLAGLRNVEARDYSERTR
jgi:hypothetical protein